MMDIRNCSKCGSIFRYDRSRICPTCRRKNEEDFQLVKDFLDREPGANISLVVEETGVETKKVIEFLREGRLEIEPGGAIVLQCEKCGVGITTGRFCNKCINTITKDISDVVVDSANSDSKKEARSTNEKFRYVNKYDRRR